jgi:hypothetical protein
MREGVMPRQFQFQSQTRAGSYDQRRTETHFPRPFEIGMAAAGALFCVAMLAGSLFAQHGLTRFAELAQHVVR